MNSQVFETFAKVLFQYGPFAIILLLLYKGHSAARENKTAALNQNDILEKRQAQTLYIALWLAIFACLSFSSYVWYRINVPTPTVFVGELANLGADDRVTFRSAEVYTQENTLAAMKTVNWTYVSAAPLNDPIVLEFVVQRASLGASDYGEKRPLLFRVSLDRQALNRVVRVDYDEENKRLSVTVDGHSQSFVQPVSGGGV